MANRENKNRPWAKDDDARLIEISLLPIQAQANALGRTTAAIVGRRAKLRTAAKVRLAEETEAPKVWKLWSAAARAQFKVLAGNPFFTKRTIALLGELQPYEVEQCYKYIEAPQLELTDADLEGIGASNVGLMRDYEYFCSYVATVDKHFPSEEALNCPIVLPPELQRVSLEIVRTGFINNKDVRYIAVYIPEEGAVSPLVTLKQGTLDWFYFACMRLVHLPSAKITNPVHDKAIRILKDSAASCGAKHKKQKRTKRKNRR